MAALTIRKLQKSFGTANVLRGVDLDVASGELVAILGASGSGKTTLLRLLCGFERADAGRIDIGAQAVAGPGLHVPPEQRRIGYVAQAGALFPHLSVAQNVLFGLPRAVRTRSGAATAWLEMVGLSAAYAGRPPAELSGGEQQRVALARALAPAPALVLLDEPFSALDAASRAETRAAVAGALSHSGATALLVTHDQAEALSMGHRVAVLRDGALVQVADPQTLYRHPVDPALAQFVGDAVLLEGEAEGGCVTCRLGRLGLLDPVADGRVTVLIRPEQVHLVSPEAAAVSATVQAVTFYGHDASLQLRLTDGTALTARMAGHLAPVCGTRAGVEVQGPVVAYTPREAAS